MSAPIRMALIGPSQGVHGAGLGRYYLRYLLSNPSVSLCALGGRDRKKLEEICDREGILNKELKLYDIDHLPDLFQSPEIDAVLIASPTLSHLEYVQMGIQYGKHMLVDKPLFEASSAIHQKQLLDQLFTKAAEQEVVLSTLCQRVALINSLPSLGPKHHLQITIGTGLKKGVYTYSQLFDYLISHPISILVKLGLAEEEKFTEFQVYREIDVHSIRLIFVFTYDTIMGKIVLQQFTTNSPTIFEVRMDDLCVSTNQVEVNQESKTQITSSDQVNIVEDFTRQSLYNFIDHLLDRQHALMISNEESYSIFNLECFFFVRFNALIDEKSD